MLKRFYIILFIGSISATANARIVDAHVHLPSPANFSEGSVTAAALIPKMNEGGIDQAFILSMAYLISDRAASQNENDYVSTQVADYPDRLFGFCGINPMMDWANEEVARCKELGNFVGMKIHTMSPGMDMTSKATIERLAGVFKQADDFGWTVLIHSGQWPVNAVVSFLRLTYEFRNAKFILGHGLFEGYRNLILASAFRKEVPDFGTNLFLEVSGLAPIYAGSPEADGLLWHLKMFGMDHVLFGSDFPIFSFEETSKSLRTLGLTEEDFENVTSNNFESFPFLGGFRSIDLTSGPRPKPLDPKSGIRKSGIRKSGRGESSP
jgi:uncharacterized protein